MQCEEIENLIKATLDQNIYGLKNNFNIWKVYTTKM